jgi:hypothetical protein
MIILGLHLIVNPHNLTGLILWVVLYLVVVQPIEIIRVFLEDRKFRNGTLLSNINNLGRRTDRLVGCERVIPRPIIQNRPNDRLTILLNQV